MSKERFEYQLLGRFLGTATGWDGDEEAFVLYDFEPAPDVALPACKRLNVNIYKGAFEPNGLAAPQDIITVLATVLAIPEPQL